MTMDNFFPPWEHTVSKDIFSAYFFQDMFYHGFFRPLKKTYEHCSWDPSGAEIFDNHS